MVSGGTATFLARHFNGSQELAGNNALVPTGTGVAGAATVAANFSVRDFLEVNASSAGSGNVSMYDPSQTETIGDSLGAAAPTPVALEHDDPHERRAAPDRECRHRVLRRQRRHARHAEHD